MTLDDAFYDQVASMAADGWDQDDAGRIDWDDFLNRVERYMNVDLPSDMTDPVIRRIQRVARAAVRETRL